MYDPSYQKLARHLDQLPGGFAPSSSGAELRLLQRLFTPEEAELATFLTLDREEAQVIATRAGLPLAETERRLAEMADKGLIFPVQSEAGVTLYQAVPFVIGIYEFQVNRLREEHLKDLAEWGETRLPRSRPQTIPQMRTIPVRESVDARLETLPYEQAYELVRAHDVIAVAPCICRRRAKMEGAGCDAPEETCLMFDEWAEYYARTGRGRRIDQAEAMQILERADAANLVLQPSNSRQAVAICCCCGCCCGILRGLKGQPKPAEAVASAFIAQLDADACQGCWTCLGRCQMEALREAGDRVALDADRCIGCGLCVSTCPRSALTLRRKPESDRTRVPATLDAAWRIISEAQA